jgi:hypothetical protein
MRLVERERVLDPDDDPPVFDKVSESVGGWAEPCGVEGLEDDGCGCNGDVDAIKAEAFVEPFAPKDVVVGFGWVRGPAASCTGGVVTNRATLAHCGCSLSSAECQTPPFCKSAESNRSARCEKTHSWHSRSLFFTSALSES